MDEDLTSGDQVEIEYESTRSGNVVSRTGGVVQAPGENGRAVLFVETDDNQLTGVVSDHVFSISTSDDDTRSDGDPRIQRTVSLGPLVSVRSR
ncbi:hypothetical protein [Saliphagus infecundisoli]|uniref:Hypervirulence associated protein TUDOR domain-containing protein n=1 Tax=Saliphagus infecundisoli TaxID=1849069 RepID=A0ABD5QJR8_9EURY|nr:hypothetical protein [Saliphagus infecundisoli]